MEYGSSHSEVVILEGILNADWYRPLFELADRLYGKEVYAYYFDLPFEETLKRHQTKPNCHEFGEAAMRRWWREKDLSGVLDERLITREKTLEDIINEISAAVDAGIGRSVMRILYGTGNQAKFSAMQSRLEKLGLELVSLKDLEQEGKIIPQVEENGDSPLENARLKALGYYEAFQMPVFSCDSGLYFENVPEKDQPGVHVRTVNGKCLSDEEMIEHYGNLARKHGDLTACYRNAICFVLDRERIYESMDPSLANEKFILTAVPHSAVRKKGFPLDSMSIDIRTGRYYYDLPEENLVALAVEDGFLKFFQEILGK